jgi:hypothetical protein
MMRIDGWGAVRLLAVMAGVVGMGNAVLAQQAGLSPEGRLTITADANAQVQTYVSKVSGRFGALAVAQDGSKAVAYLCQSRLWKNCDEPGNEETSIAVPSGKIARDEALTKCRSATGSACILLFINDDQQREFSVQP